jgi:hypothetical protein
VKYLVHSDFVDPLLLVSDLARIQNTNMAFTPFASASNTTRLSSSIQRVEHFCALSFLVRDDTTLSQEKSITYDAQMETL